jgi:hypothetical protein
LIAVDETAPSELEAWLQTQASFEEAWRMCERADWLYWLALARVGNDEEQRRRLVDSVAWAMRRSDARTGVRKSELQIASLWGVRSFDDDPDPTGFTSTMVGLAAGGVAAAAVSTWLKVYRHVSLRSEQHETYGMPALLIVAALVRLALRPLLLWRWRWRIRHYSFARAEKRLFSRFAGVVARTSESRQRDLVDSMRRGMKWDSPAAG